MRDIASVLEPARSVIEQYTPQDQGQPIGLSSGRRSARRDVGPGPHDRGIGRHVGADHRGHRPDRTAAQVCRCRVVVLRPIGVGGAGGPGDRRHGRRRLRPDGSPLAQHCARERRALRSVHAARRGGDAAGRVAGRDAGRSAAAHAEHCGPHAAPQDDWRSIPVRHSIRKKSTCSGNCRGAWCRASTASKGRRGRCPSWKTSRCRRPRCPDFLVQMQNVLKAHQVTASLFAHAAHGQLHIRPFLDLASPATIRKMQDVATDLYQQVLAVGGTISGEHGDGLSRSWFVPQQFGPLYDVFRQVKRLFDPQNILNPGKKVADAPQPVTANLRPVVAAPPRAGRCRRSQPKRGRNRPRFPSPCSCPGRRCPWTTPRGCAMAAVAAARSCPTNGCARSSATARAKRRRRAPRPT